MFPHTQTNCGCFGHRPSLHRQEEEASHCKHHCTQLPSALSSCNISTHKTENSLSQSHTIPPICSWSPPTKSRPLTTDGRCSCRKQNPQRQISSPSPWTSGRASPLAYHLQETQAKKDIRKYTVHGPAFSPRLVMGWRKLGITI